jgi:hypothetical protein
VGEYQPRKGKRQVPDGDPVPNYYPAAVTEEEYLAARAGMAARKRAAGRIGTHVVNVFAGLVLSARDGEPYYLMQRAEKERYHVLANGSHQHGAPVLSFPYHVFEKAILSLLAEVDPQEIVGGNGGAGEVTTLAGELAEVEDKIASLEAELEDGDIPSLARALRAQEERRRDLAGRLAEARQKAAHPLAESWGQCQSLAAVLSNAPDPEDARLRLRSALRRVVSEIRLLVVPRKLVRLAAVQVHFEAGGTRDYIIYYRRSHAGFGHHKPEVWWARSLTTVARPDDLDLRRRADARKLEAVLAELDLAG